MMTIVISAGIQNDGEDTGSGAINTIFTVYPVLVCRPARISEESRGRSSCSKKRLVPSGYCGGIVIIHLETFFRADLDAAAACYTVEPVY